MTLNNLPATKIPLVDLRAQYRAHKAEFDGALSRVLEAAAFVGGHEHAAFGEEFAAWCGGGFCALVGNGTDALTLAIVEVLGQGDGTGEIVCPSHTFIATCEAITAAGYRPVFAEIDPETYTVSAATMEAVVSDATRALLPVHLYGQMAPMDEISALARLHSLPVMEDAAQAHGARWDGEQPGAWGAAACFSFYPGKNLGAWGDGGAVLTRDRDLAKRITMRANHGRSEKYIHRFEGVNSRLDGLQAAILRVKLGHLDDWNAARRRAAAWYDELLADRPEIVTPTVRPKAEHVYHLYVVQVDQRDRVLAHLNKNGIGAGIHYPVPLHEQPAFAHLGYTPGDLPVTSEAAKRIVSLPIFPEMTHHQVQRVARVLIEGVSAK